MTIPHSAEAESAIISAMIVDAPKALPRVRESITADCFYDPTNALLFTALCEMHTAGEPVELPAIVHRLTESQIFDKIGGMNRLMQFDSSAGNIVTLDYYLGIAKTKERLRKGVLFCQSLLNDSTEGVENASDWTGKLLEGAMKIHEGALDTGKKSGEMHHDVGQNVVREFTDKNKPRGIDTGFEWLDGYTGGMRPGKLWVVAGGISDGKSSLALQMCLAAALNHPGSIYSLEMSNEEIWQRSACQEARVRSSVWSQRGYTPQDFEGIQHHMQAHYPIRIFDDLDSLSQITASIRMEVARRKIKWVMIDYIQLMDGEKANGREREVAGMSQAFKRLALNLDITIIILSQLNDEGKLRESRAIGADADHVILLKTEDEDQNRRVLSIQKNRGGPRFKKCHYDFNGEYFFFTEGNEISDSAPKPQTQTKGKKTWQARHQ